MDTGLVDRWHLPSLTKNRWLQIFYTGDEAILQALNAAEIVVGRMLLLLIKVRKVHESLVNTNNPIIGTGYGQDIG